MKDATEHIIMLYLSFLMTLLCSFVMIGVLMLYLEELLPLLAQDHILLIETPTGLSRRNQSHLNYRPVDRVPQSVKPQGLSCNDQNQDWDSYEATRKT